MNSLENNRYQTCTSFNLIRLGIIYSDGKLNVYLLLVTDKYVKMRIY